MNRQTTESLDPKIHVYHFQNLLGNVVTYEREDIDKIDDPVLQALLETSAEVTLVLKTIFNILTKALKLHGNVRNQFLHT